ncbi:MAG: hypothetical protein COC15_05185 [Legionellales bacterium]|nr:MAG: hypothetical protein COC15_05185 [Legionellales bacterium]
MTHTIIINSQKTSVEIGEVEYSIAGLSTPFVVVGSARKFTKIWPLHLRWWIKNPCVVSSILSSATIY